MNIIFHYAAGADLAAQLTAIAGHRIDIVAEDEDARLRHLLPEVDVLWHVLKPCTAAMIDAAPRLKLIQKIGVGVNTIDMAAARARGVPVCNLPGTNAQAVAELTLALIFSCLRKLPRYDAAMRAGTGWTLPSTMQDGLYELAGRTVGLVGYGAIPRILAPALRALGCTVIYTTRTPRADIPDAYCPLPDLLARADILSLHIPQTPETTRLIDAAALARMKRGAILINTARGGLVDQSALVAALLSGHLAAAGLDVFAEEPSVPADPILTLENVVLTPHIGWLTSGTFARSFSIATENCRRLGAGEDLLHRVA
ncbi:MAG: hydroxyacid dehydrogenase [Acetobacteraceae bacterium]|nr:hydroxyacid dehydrogenase [Acetobacteraceae bacterium]